MKYLQDSKYYEDLYDLHTVKLCLDRVDLLRKVAKKMHGAKELKHLSEEKKQRDMNFLSNTQLLDLKLHRYKKRIETIEEWIESDRLKQDAQDNIPPPTGIKCDKCKSKMCDTIHHLDSTLDEPVRVLFFFECDKCNLRKAVYDDGEEWIHEPNLCKKCNSELDTDYKSEGDITTWTTKCTSCDFKEVDIRDDAKEKAERKKKKRQDEKLIKKYRSEFCLKQEKAEEYIRAFEEIAFVNEVYEYELQEYEDPAYEKAYTIKKLTISKLEKVIIKQLKPKRFHKLSLDKPKIDQFVLVGFTVQDNDSSRNSTESIRQLEKTVKKLLEQTNWRLTADGISYRLGYLTGTLKGYEREEDILNILGKKKTKPKKKLDPEMQKRYGHSNSVQLVKMSAEFEATRRIRMKRLKDEPDGFLLEDSEGGNYSCNLCYKSIPGSETWWTPDGITCFYCHRNIKEGVISAEILKNDKIWFRDGDLKDEFGLHHATVRKLVRKGELVGCELKDKDGNTYETVFMVEDNVDFFKTHPRKGKRKQRWHYVDGDGEVVWL